jgi:hypothetical protein
LTVAKSIDRIHVSQLHRVVPALAHTEVDKATTAALVTYGVQRHGRYLYELEYFWYCWKTVQQREETTSHCNPYNPVSETSCFLYSRIADDGKSPITL